MLYMIWEAPSAATRQPICLKAQMGSGYIVYGSQIYVCAMSTGRDKLKQYLGKSLLRNEKEGHETQNENTCIVIQNAWMCLFLNIRFFRIYMIYTRGNYRCHFFAYRVQCSSPYMYIEPVFSVTMRRVPRISLRLNNKHHVHCFLCPVTYTIVDFM